MVERLDEVCGIQKMNALAVVQDVETRWWSTASSVGRCLYLCEVVELHEPLDKVPPLLSATDWELLNLIQPIMSLSVTAHT